MSKKPSRAQRKEKRARSAKPRIVSTPHIATPTPAAETATSSGPSQPEPAPIAPKEAAHRRHKRTGAKSVAKAAETTTIDKQIDSTPPAAPTKKKPNRDLVFLAFAALIVAAAGIAYFATRKPSLPPLQEDKLTNAAEKPPEQPADVAPAPVVIAPPPTAAAPAPTTTVSAVPVDKPAPIKEPSTLKTNDQPATKDKSPKASAAPKPTRPSATGKPVPVKTDDYE